jgi:HD-GYP domain-containing protein (c-di-GMP phosphodiesterase class II)
VGRRIVVSGVSTQIQGTRWESTEIMRIGRQEGLEIALNDASVSREHAEIRARGDGWFIRDTGSTNGTRVNNEPLHQSERKLELNDLIQCGKLFLRVSTIEMNSPAPEPLPPSRFVRKADPPKRVRTSGSFLKIQAHARNTWDKALEMATVAPDAQSSASQHLAVLLRTGYHLSNIASLEDLLTSLLHEAVSVLEAQRGVILLQDEASGELKLRKRVIVDPSLDEESRSYSQTLANRSFSEGESMLCQDTSAAVDLRNTSGVEQGSMASIVCALLRTPRRPIGVLHLDRGVNQPPFSHDEFYLADALAASIAVGIESAQLVHNEREQFIQTVTALARTVEIRDRYTTNHSQRVTDYSLLIGRALDLPQSELNIIRIGTPLHDIGKIGIPDYILRKQGQLTEEELKIMRTHPEKGAGILEPIAALRPMLPIVRNHHERWDGTGYPDQLGGVQIPRVARIVSVADAFDAMTSNRPYRKAMSTEVAFTALAREMGMQFDADCVHAFLAQRDRISNILALQPVFAD